MFVTPAKPYVARSCGRCCRRLPGAPPAPRSSDRLLGGGGLDSPARLSCKDLFRGKHVQTRSAGSQWAIKMTRTSAPFHLRSGHDITEMCGTTPINSCYLVAAPGHQHRDPQARSRMHQPVALEPTCPLVMDTSLVGIVVNISYPVAVFKRTIWLPHHKHVGGGGATSQRVAMTGVSWLRRFKSSLPLMLQKVHNCRIVIMARCSLCLHAPDHRLGPHAFAAWGVSHVAHHRHQLTDRLLA